MLGGPTTQRWTVRGILRATLPVLLVLTVVAVGSGLVLGGFEEALYEHPSLLVLVPVTIGTAGSLGSLLASRLSTAFHLGTLSFSLDDEHLLGHTIATILLALSAFPAVGVGAWAIVSALGTRDLALTTVLAIATGSGAALAVLTVAVTLATTYGAYVLGLDPDDVVIPVVTVTCDVLGVVVLFVMVSLFT
ncbi:magnesium transporter [Halanaeroarchaeum sulfurireducens]|uniref:Divalent cation transporter subunit II, MgtE family protein n=1 Tax=Halanaeroarchaeum sulfurireducens TaxID=1604004 RepID=A0A0F7PCY1_9EURY|nr:magnesium transporter [Halanaeroarchaeum sulfurireducens]AKH98582.1 divalent cation transporter subunit II, MgtE family protein [Halanaeroarchaeum sulfurireducens]ALG83024.1 divalent cation transporter subunit II, MgtE family protein [Halanaeroarchaeum sulfurireducens]